MKQYNITMSAQELLLIAKSLDEIKALEQDNLKNAQTAIQNIDKILIKISDAFS